MSDTWRMFDKGQRQANPIALEKHCNELIHMAKQKTGGQNRNDNKKDLPFECLDMIKWSIICEACFLVLDEKWEDVKRMFEDRKDD
ncbi:MAG TPA: hypothetical protein DEA28_00065 [Firmicutes bacterium]|nr:hypothetical protein [Bacillota bacterium]